ncbi:MAG: CAP domain-containing protein [bacterium]|nr:CAP domain-containing protein [bacterium]
MKEFFKKYFIPHEGNDHKPHFLRPKMASYVFAAIIAVELLFLGNLFALDPSRPFLGAIFPSVLVDLANDNRTDDHLATLKINPVLERAAQDKANDMATKGYFSHTTPEGLAPWYFFYKNDYNFSYAGENLAVNFLDSKDAMDAWMASPKHRDNILNGNFTETGIALAEGTYKGQKATFIVQLFGKPAPQTSIPRLTVAPAVAVAATPEPAPTVKPPAPSFGSHSTDSGQAAQDKPPQAVTLESQPQELYLEVSQPVDSPVPAAEEPAAIAPAMNLTPDTSLTERLVSMPKTTTNYFFFALLILVSIALALKIFVNFHIQHPALIFRGVFLLITIGYLILENDSLVRTASQIF